MELKFTVCPHAVKNLKVWQEFVKALERNLNQKIIFDASYTFSEEFKKVEENYTFYYVSVFTGINLYKKGYIPVARFKNSLDKYIFISIQPLEKIIKKRYIKFATLNNPYFLLSLSYFSLSINLDITRFNTYFFESCEEIIEKIKNGEIDIGFIHYENFLDSKNKDEIKIHEKYTLEIPHYFMVINEPQLIEKIKQFLGSLDKNLIQTLGCKKIQIISEENLKLLKYIFPFCDITFNLLNAQKLSRALIDSPYFGVLIYHKKYVWANEYACNLLGYSLEELKKLKPEEILHGFNNTQIREIVKRRLKGEFFLQKYENIEYKRKDGKKGKAIIFTNTIFYENKYCGLVILIDVTEQKELEKLNKLITKVNRLIIYSATEDELYSDICKILVNTLDLNSALVLKVDKEKNLIYPIYWYPKEIPYINKLNFIIDKNFLQSDLSIAKALKTKEIIFRPIHKKDILNSRIQFECIIPLSKNKEIDSILIMYSSEKTFFEEKYKYILEEVKNNLNFAIKKLSLLVRDKIIREALEKLDEIVIIADENLNIEYINQFTIKLLDLYEKDLSKLNCRDLFLLNHEEIKSISSFQILKKLLTYKKTLHKILVLEIKILKVSLPDNKEKIVIIGKDLTKKIELERDIQTLKHYDTLTELLNLRGFFQKVSELISFLDTKALFILINIYNFSYINHFYGFTAGDHCLQEIAKRLKRFFPKDAILGRLFGDYFGVFVKAPEQNYEEFGKRILNELSKPIEWKNRLILPEFNIGIVVFPDNGKTFPELYQKADLLLKEIKKSGSQNVGVFTPPIEDKFKTYFRKMLLVRDALKENLFVFYYQPIFKISNLKIVALEALVRIKVKDKIVSPKEFIDYLEESPYLEEFEDWAIHKIVEKIMKWKIPISFNITPKSIKTVLMIENIRKYKNLFLDSSYFLILEFTERILLDEPQWAKDVIEFLKTLNVKIALDDFGTGYSSLNYLKDLPIDYLKIDHSFIKNIVNDKKIRHIVKLIIDLANNFNIKTIAEGVETEEQLNILRDLNCNYVQGYFLGVPQPEEDIEKLLKS